MRSFVLFIVAFILGGCTSSGVIPIGQDTYSISTTSELSPAYAKKNAMNEALKYCQSLGKEIMPMQMKEGTHRDTFGDNLATFDYTFRCLAAGDPQLGRPELKDPTVNVNITDSSPGDRRVTESKSQDDLYTQLVSLDRLRNEGIISDEEFEEQKRRVLASQD
jgi:hypothetical protein